KPEIMGQFSAVIDGMAEACRVFGTPVTGGNVSFYNETRGQGIHPTPVIGMLGLLDNVERALGSGFRAVGSAIVLLGGKSGVEHAPEPAFSSSEYARLIYGVTGGEPPAIDLAYEKRVQDCVLEAHRRALLAAAHDISDGGLLVALAECCFAAEPARGVAVTLGGKQPLEAVLFGEEPSRLLLEVDEKQLAELLRLAREYQVEARQLGWTSAGEFRVHFNRQVVLEEDIATLREVWQAGLPQALQTVEPL
ncbi:MAG: AIR synthase-related protein, partial [Candidatus Acidiferrales bacterium]